MKKKLLLMILDGWGEGKQDHSNVIHNANTPFVESLHDNPEWKYSKINTSGECVGLPKGQMGNSEVGHLNIGAGRVVYQDFVKINKSVENNEISENIELNKAFAYAKQNKKAIHLIGLVSEGGVHSSIKHLEKLCEIATLAGVNDIFIHALTDGRDTDPYSGRDFIAGLENNISSTNARIASVCGRYYTMDRDKRWERVKKGYDLMIQGIGKPFTSAIEGIESSYAAKISDEFIEPIVIVDDEKKPIATIQENDVVICFNFRTDRLREITTVLTQTDYSDYGMKTLPLYYLTMTRYDEQFKNVHVIFDKDFLTNTLGEVISKNGLRQIRIAETEKYPHVTFFFSGGREEMFEHENRILIQSPKVSTYDLQPSMSAFEVKDAIIKELEQESADFVCLNFANADMVGHTGVYEAIKEAVETVDMCVSEIVPIAQEHGYSIIITSDHGNADYAVNPDGSPNTAHSLNPVPLFLYDPSVKSILPTGRLSNIAPTILKIMNIEVPNIMDPSLIEE